MTRWAIPEPSVGIVGAPAFPSIGEKEGKVRHQGSTGEGRMGKAFGYWEMEVGPSRTKRGLAHWERRLAWGVESRGKGYSQAALESSEKDCFYSIRHHGEIKRCWDSPVSLAADMAASPPVSLRSPWQNSSPYPFLPFFPPKGETRLKYMRRYPACSVWPPPPAMAFELPAPPCGIFAKANV